MKRKLNQKEFKNYEARFENVVYFERIIATSNNEAIKAALKLENEFRGKLINVFLVNEKIF